MSTAEGGNVRVIVPTQLRGYTGGAAEVLATGKTLDAVLRDLDARFGGFRFGVVDEQDRVRPHILLFVGDERCDRLDTPIPPGHDVFIVGALSGG